MKTNKINELLMQCLSESTGFMSSDDVVNFIYEQVSNIEKIELFKETVRKSVAEGIRKYSNKSKLTIVCNQCDLFEFEGALAVFGGVIKTEYADKKYLLAHKENSNVNRQRVDAKDDELNEQVAIMMAGMDRTNSSDVGEWQKIEAEKIRKVSRHRGIGN